MWLSYKRALRGEEPPTSVYKSKILNHSNKSDRTDAYVKVARILDQFNRNDLLSEIDGREGEVVRYVRVLVVELKHAGQWKAEGKATLGAIKLYREYDSGGLFGDPEVEIRGRFYDKDEFTSYKVLHSDGIEDATQKAITGVIGRVNDKCGDREERRDRLERATTTLEEMVSDVDPDELPDFREEMT